MTTRRVQIQFHADPEEAVELALRLAREQGLTVVVESFFPRYRARKLGDDGTVRHADRVVLCSRVPDLSAATAHGFTTRNSDCLYLVIGPYGREGLRESMLGGVSDDDETWRRWKAMIGRARAGMHRGATARDPASGTSSPDPAHLHMRGAHALAEQGVAMLAIAGSTRFDFDEACQCR